MSDFGLKILALIIAVLLWIQVHGQGMGSITVDARLELLGLPQNMVIINDFPEKVHLTINGLQSRLQALDNNKISVPLNVADIREPGILMRSIALKDIQLPMGLHVEKAQPDQLELQVDMLIEREFPIHANLIIPDNFTVQDLKIEPAKVTLNGPEIWVDNISNIQTVSIRLAAEAGPFEKNINMESLAGKSIRLQNPNTTFRVHGWLVKTQGESEL
ncbi:MAG: CdaR family protein [Mariprofundaceae bacterium]|nr:CdaR family protein [Mariprofundaceae bacterium]